MAEWSERTANYVANQIKNWLAEYFEENYQRQLNPNPGTDNITFFVELFAEKMYDNHLKTPKAWTGGAAYETISWYFPTKVVIEADDAGFVIPSIVSFVNFLGDKGYIRNAKTIERAVYDAEEEFFETLQAPENFGFAKQLAMQAIEAGVDFSDPEQLKSFIDAENEVRAQENTDNAISFFAGPFPDFETEKQKRKRRNKMNKLLGKKSKKKRKK